MTRSELPDNWQDLAAGYVLNNLSEDEVAFWENLLQQHPELSEEVEAFQSMLHVFADVVPMHNPPDKLLAQIHSAMQTGLTASHTPQVSMLQPKTSGQFGDRGRGGWQIGGAIAASIIALLGFNLYSLRSDLQQASVTIQKLERELQLAQAQIQTVRPVVNTLQQPGGLIYSLEGSKLANAASGRLVLSDSREVIIIVQNLPELPAGKVYRLWAAFPQKTGLTYCGQFNSNTQGVIQLASSSNHCTEDPTQVVVTLDAVTDPTTRGGPIVMQGQ